MGSRGALVLVLLVGCRAEAAIMDPPAELDAQIVSTDVLRQDGAACPSGVEAKVLYENLSREGAAFEIESAEMIPASGGATVALALYPRTSGWVAPGEALELRHLPAHRWLEPPPCICGEHTLTLRVRAGDEVIDRSAQVTLTCAD